MCLVGQGWCLWQRVVRFLSNFLVGILEGDRPLFRMTLGQIRGGPTEIKWTREMARQRRPGMHSWASFSSWLVERTQPPLQEDMEDLRATGHQEVSW